MTRTNILYLLVGVLAVTAAVLGYQVYQDRKEPKGLQINIGPGGLAVEKK
jgi:RsiW-degrading membrane proteinase PrsW (M82 family)